MFWSLTTQDRIILDMRENPIYMPVLHHPKILETEHFLQDEYILRGKRVVRRISSVILVSKKAFYIGILNNNVIQ